MYTNRLLPVLVTALCLAGCSEPALQVPLYQLESDTLAHSVNAEGELFAVNSVSISAPGTLQGPRFIASLASEYTEVQAGDIVVTFDASQLQKARVKASTGLGAVLADEQQKQAEQLKEQTTLGLEQRLIGHEFSFADRFTIDDVQIRSRLEIIDSMQNKEYLGDKQAYLGWQEQSFSQRSQGELELLQLQRGQQQNLLQQAETGLEQLEVRSPHQGIILYETNWRGEKPEVGGMVFPGHRIGSIPDLSLQHLKLYVIEQEAVGLLPGQQVNFALTAWPDETLSAKIVAVAPVAQSRERRDPRKYIEVRVEPDAQDPRFLPGNKVRANIVVNRLENVLLVPLQAIFSEQQQLYVYKRQQAGFIKQVIQIGTKSLSHAQILAGLQAGDEIALIKPESII
ncbi:MAG: efflux RND transporter periplasmic adaptor subunit [Gammaproteobacteria bacterium]|nr:efflux RND transporter periplasmic adaptor subunit [Gammaproteobacteria bacterium]MBU1555440.1 efflux RND transporter periplasmic adaptor subunit [Gammaproteobacteria bacterium]MBU2070895.1 efflux RND transporter periplasmic adaptor subunit [Gammaproteobacteria bacterium]MBU2185012.1 efflux RND transporter periplasmic adaptor subunit [Gammaproteobacteria bacterium]MBU2204101.1 efflux RND transporter periplasmic adaptor subunit [Gammaproteobacteria bacterium]